MSEGPGYRLRLFLSVDLAGSTAFKNGAGGQLKDNDPFPLWVGSIRQFYREFPLLVRQHFERVSVGSRSATDYGPCPEVWKSIGDELLFCARLLSHEHLAGCIGGFLAALDSYGKILDASGKHMDVKGAGWVAAFPAANVTVTSTELPSTTDYLAEDLENEADKTPRGFDFLGRDIDSGFRVARHATSDRFIASIELAWLLSEAHRNRFVGCNFGYHGRHILKGVLKERPYPIISLDTERSTSRRDVRSYEQALLPTVSLDSTKIRDFCGAFMKDEGIELPVLNRDGESLDQSSLPGSYRKFLLSAKETLRENAERDKAEREAGEEPDGIATELPDDVIELAKNQINKIL